MSRRAQENLIAAALLVLFAGVILLCQDFGPRARMIPLPLAVFGIVLTVLQIFWQNLGSTDALRIDMIEVRAPAAPVQPGEVATAAAEKPGRRVTWREEAMALAIVAALIALILLLGLLPAVFLFTGGYFALTRQYSLKASVLYTTGLTVAIYLLFVVALQIEPYHGMLAPVVERFR